MAAPEPKSPRATSATNTATAPASAPKTTPAKPRPSARGDEDAGCGGFSSGSPWRSLSVCVAAGPSLVSWTPLGRQLIARYAPVNGSVEVGSLSVGWFTSAVAHRGRGPRCLRRNAGRDCGGPGRQAAVAAGDELSRSGPVRSRATQRPCRGAGRRQQPRGFSGPIADWAQRRWNADQRGDQADRRAGHARRSTDATQLSISRSVAGSRMARGRRSVAQLANRAANSWMAEAPPSWRCWSRPRWATRRIRWAKDGCRAAAINCRSTSWNRSSAANWPERSLAGSVSVGLDGNWGEGDDGGDVSLEGQVDVADLLFTAPAMGTDRLEMARLHAPCRIAGKGGRIDIEQLLLDCDLGDSKSAARSTRPT